MMRPLLLAVIAASLVPLCGCQAQLDTAFGASPAAQQQGAAPYTSIYFSPQTNMETVDISLIGSARKSLDIAMYAFTDVRIADALRQAAGRGVRIRLYRDHDQFAQEMRHGGKVMAILEGVPGIQVRVKHSSELMHEKAFLIDGRQLRDGSGNWSVSAARYQDNQVSTTTEPSQCADFAADFAAMWGRADNLVVQ